ncbi:MAG: 2-hydroxyacid dehydrogenase, partial [Clostridia bacterium]|nr:2-hydroxyacid dehydrogenase [Clostridia bacterium]
MKTIAVCDAFMKKEYYEECFRRFPEYELTSIIHFGTLDRKSMRDPIHNIERHGPDAVDPPRELFDAVTDCEVLMVHLCPVPRRLIEKAPNLKFILLNRGGTENVDLQAAADHGVVVLNNPAHNANSVTELTLGLMLAETRNIARTHADLMKGVWCEHYSNTGRVYELSRRTVGIIGFGNIGRRVARKLTAFDCRVLVYDKYVPATDPDIARYNATFTDLKTLMNQSDIVTLHVRSNDLVLGREELMMMKDGAYFINTARPHLIDNAAMIEMLSSGKLAGAAFDVFMQEPIDENEPYIKLDNVTLTNHRGGDTVNCYSDSPAMLLEQANVYLAGG